MLLRNTLLPHKRCYFHQHDEGIQNESNKVNMNWSNGYTRDTYKLTGLRRQKYWMSLLL